MFSFMQDLGCFDRIPWATSWTNGQIVDMLGLFQLPL
jgi:hypothetical protein